MTATHGLHLAVHAAAMSRLAAGSVARSGAGRVHSVFRRCFNVTTPGGDWLTVAIAPFPKTPDAVIVDARQFASFPSPRIEPGMGVEIARDIISILDAGFAVTLAGTPVFDTRREPVARIRGAESEARVARNLTLAQETIRRDGRVCEEPEFLARAKPAVSALCDAIVSNDAATMRAQCERLLGLGIGLTPSGDDILCGIAAGLFLGGAAGGGNHFLPVLRGLLRDGARTTDVSARSLRLCADAEINDIVYEAATAILCEGGAAVRRAVSALLAQGGTSGAETAQGLCAGLQIAESLSENSKHPGILC